MSPIFTFSSEATFGGVFGKEKLKTPKIKAAIPELLPLF
jgi:hypothetical protein